jgi:ribosomal protein S18 acetylase RimI-like enzyme
MEMRSEQPGGQARAEVPVALTGLVRGRPSTPELQVSRCHDVGLIRQLRLRALKADPDAFLADLGAEEQRDEKAWERETRSCTWVAATTARRGVGVGVARVRRAVDGIHLEALWVDRAHRRLGVATRLMHELLAIARQEGATRVYVWVLDGNAAALALYRRLGFIPTRESQRLPDGRTERRFVRPIG